MYIYTRCSRAAKFKTKPTYAIKLLSHSIMLQFWITRTTASSITRLVSICCLRCFRFQMTGFSHSPLAKIFVCSRAATIPNQFDNFIPPSRYTLATEFPVDGVSNVCKQNHMEDLAQFPAHFRNHYIESAQHHQSCVQQGFWGINSLAGNHQSQSAQNDLLFCDWSSVK